MPEPTPPLCLPLLPEPEGEPAAGSVQLAAVSCCSSQLDGRLAPSTCGMLLIVVVMVATPMPARQYDQSPATIPFLPQAEQGDHAGASGAQSSDAAPQPASGSGRLAPGLRRRQGHQEGS